jgi:hypothetical protein
MPGRAGSRGRRVRRTRQARQGHPAPRPALGRTRCRPGPGPATGGVPRRPPHVRWRAAVPRRLRSRRSSRRPGAGVPGAPAPGPAHRDRWPATRAPREVRPGWRAAGRPPRGRIARRRQVRRRSASPPPSPPATRRATRANEGCCPVCESVRAIPARPVTRPRTAVATTWAHPSTPANEHAATAHRPFRRGWQAPSAVKSKCLDRYRSGTVRAMSSPESAEVGAFGHAVSPLSH